VAAAAGATTAKKDEKKDEKRSWLDNVADGITITVREIHITVITLGPVKSDEPNPLVPPLLLVDVARMRLVATNSRYEARHAAGRRRDVTGPQVVDLKQTRLYDRERTQVALFKVIRCDAVTVALASADMRQRMTLLRNLPLTIRVRRRGGGGARPARDGGRG
jgi:hypothetical protein